MHSITFYKVENSGYFRLFNKQALSYCLYAKKGSILEKPYTFTTLFFSWILLKVCTYFVSLNLLWFILWNRNHDNSSVFRYQEDWPTILTTHFITSLSSSVNDKQLMPFMDKIKDSVLIQALLSFLKWVLDVQVVRYFRIFVKIKWGFEIVILIIGKFISLVVRYLQKCALKLEVN